jgi:hypothetical protein
MKGRDIGEEITTRNGALSAIPVAGGAGDATEVTGLSIDRNGLGSLYESCKLVVFGQGNVTSGLTLSIAANLQDSADDSTFADFGTAHANAVALTGASGGSTQSAFVVELDNDLRGANRYIRCQFTPDLSDTNDDTANVNCLIIFGGATTYPAS